MRSKKSYGLYILGVPVLENDAGVYFREPKFYRTVCNTRPFVSRSLLVARSRKRFHIQESYPRIDKVGAELVMVLPDYGAGGCRGLTNLLICLYSPQIQNRLRAYIEGASFIYVSAPSWEAFLAARASKKVDRRLIMEMRGSALLHKEYMRKRFGILGEALRLMYLRQLVRIRNQSQAALYVSQKLQKEFPLKNGVQAVIPDVYLPESFGGKPREYNQPPASYLYVGHLETVKRVDLLLNALHIARLSLPDGWHFHIIGTGPLREDLEELAVELNLDDHVTFHGRIKWGEPLAAYYQRADLLLMASITEGASRVLMEAMAFGLPVISTGVGTAPDLLAKESIVLDSSPDAYANRLLRLVHDPQKLTAFSEQNWRKAQAFSAACIQEERRAFWQQVLVRP